MNKREIKGWLENKKWETIAEENESYEKAKVELKRQLAELSGLSSLLREFCEINKEWFEKYHKWKAFLDKDTEKSLVIANCYSSTASHMEKLNEEPDCFIDVFLSDSVDERATNPVYSLANSHRIRVDNIKKSYEILLRNITSCRNAKEATKYLIELGFELPNDAPRELPMTMEAIDTSFLGIKK